MYFTYKLSSTDLRKLLNWSSFSLVVLDIRESYRLCFAQKEQILKIAKKLDRSGDLKTAKKLDRSGDPKTAKILTVQQILKYRRRN